MALAAPTLLVAATTAASEAAITSGSFTPAASSLILVVVSLGTSGGTNPTHVTIIDTLGGLTWTRVEQQLFNSGNSTVAAIFYAVAPASPSAGTVTVTPSPTGGANAGMTLTAYQVTGADTTTPVGATGSSTQSATVTLSATPATSSMVISTIETYVGTDPAQTIPSGYNGLVTDRHTGANAYDSIAYKLTLASSTVTWGGGVSNAAAVAIEIIQAAPVLTVLHGVVVSTLQFVDSISASPTVLLDLNNANPFTMAAGWSFKRPPLKRALSGTLLRDGQIVSSSAYDNRELDIPLLIVVEESPAGRTIAAQAFRNLHRLLNQEMVLLKWVREAGQTPVFFRILRSPEYDDLLDYMPLRSVKIGLKLLAEPFALGLEQTIATTVDINNDPAAATNPMFYDATGVLGDVETPAMIKINDNTTTSGMIIIVARRSHGTPSAVTRFKQAETADLLTNDTSSQAITGFSGGNGARVTFATHPEMIERLNFVSLLGAESVDVAGTYRVYARVARNGGASSDDFQIQGGFFFAGTTLVAGSVVNVNNLTGPQIVDLGIFYVNNNSSDTNGYGAEYKTVSGDFQVLAARASGTGSLDIDYLLFLPADESLVRVDFGVAAQGYIAVLDGPNDDVYVTETAPGWIKSGFTRLGSLPMLVPNQTNRLFLIRTRTAIADDITDDVNFTLSYWPRYLYVAP